MAKIQRTRRTPINGSRNILKVEGKDPNFEYRIVNDTGDRIEQFKEQGYETVVDSSIRVGDRRVANPTSEGSPVQISVGGGQKAFLMRIKKEWYEEDQKIKQQYVNQTEAAIKKDAESDFGNISISRQ